mgnify:FL=1
MIIHSIRSLLLSQPSIVTALPSQSVNRVSLPAVFCDHAPQGFTPPFAVVTDLGQDTMLTLADPVFGMRALELDIDVYGYDEPSTRSAMQTIRQFFDDYSGPAGDNTILAVIWQDESYSYVKSNEGRDTRYHVATTNYLVQFE